MNTDTQTLERTRNAVRLELGIWDALIGAQSSPAIQKFAIQHRLYAFARAVVKVSNDDFIRELHQTHSLVNKGSGAKIKQFIDFIEGDLSLDEVMTIRDDLRSILDTPIIQLASA